MIYIPVGRLQAGMRLAADVKAYNSNHEQAMLLPKDTVLTQRFVNKIGAFRIEGAYIDDGRKYIVNIKKIIDDQTRRNIVTNLEDTFTHCHDNNSVLSSDSIASIENISSNLVNSIINEDSHAVGIVDLQAYDDCTYHHSLSVAVISIAIGAKMELSKEKLALLGTAALLHDIGKLDVPIEIITKPARLTDDEFTTIKNHPQLGANHLMENNEHQEEIYQGVLMHHEKYDGTGYPNGLRGEEIPLFARIISIADVYDALTATRPYRKPMQPQEAMEYIMANGGTVFDFDIINIFLQVIEPFPVGCCVKLSDGRFAVVTAPSKSIPLRPVVQTVDNYSKTLDLSNDVTLSSIVITGIDYSFTVEKKPN
ncbi:MAG: HD-GYP domain-containing protein [Hydrogenoanaerobacterium sp.]